MEVDALIDIVRGHCKALETRKDPPPLEAIAVVRTVAVCVEELNTSGTKEQGLKGEDFLVHRFQRCGCTKALLRLAVMSPLHRSELLVCIECG